MTNASPFDDDWAELARELERDKPAAHSPAKDHAGQDASAHSEDDGSPTELDPEVDDSGPEDLEDGGDAGTEGDGDGEAGEDAAAGDGPPGTGRKRRRRRRRRRKGGSPADGATAEDAERPTSEEPEPDEPEAAAESELVEDLSTEDEPAGALVAETEEDAGGELLRDLIANWNVPSWDEVVSGLYRPER